MVGTVFRSSDFKVLQARWKVRFHDGTDAEDAERSGITKGGFTYDERTCGKQPHGSIA